MPIIFGGGGGAASTPTLAEVLVEGSDTEGNPITGGIVANAISGIEVINAKSSSAASDYQDAFLVRNTANDHLFTVDTAGDCIVQLKRNDAQVGINALDAATLPPFYVRGQSINQVFAILVSGAYITRANAAPADAALSAGDAAVWFDPTNGAAAFNIKAKQANGTVKTATIPVIT